MNRPRAPQRAPARAAAGRAIDVHAHFYPERFLGALAQDGGAPGFTVEYTGPGGPVMVAGDRRLTLDPTYWDLEKRIARMNAQGVTLHALSLTTPMVHWAPPERGARLAAIVNDAMVEAHRAFPDRLVGCATLPLQDPALALKELDRAAALPGIRGVYLPTNVGGRELSEPAFFPIYERCEALRLPVLLHPIVVIGLERLQKKFYLQNLLGNPFDTAVAAAHLVFGGVLDRFPRLDVVLPHAGGAMPYLMGRLQHGQGVRPETKAAARKRFGDYRRRFHYDTITHSPELLRILIALVGPDRVTLGSDYCFDMGYQRPRDIIGAIGLKPADRAKLLSGNAARLLRL
jgi:aminocarboxymuconate-semialdehyde decarboxylase